MRSAGAADRATGADERLVHDFPDGAGATAALGRTAEAAIDLAGGARRFGRAGGADGGVGQDVAGADDHQKPGVGGSLTAFDIALSYLLMTALR